jgi:peptide/nickel transport system permease protein
MLSKYPTLMFIVHRSGWYFLTFLVAITINFFLPRFGADPIDMIMSKQKGLSDKQARDKEVAYLKEFGLVDIEKVATNIDGDLFSDGSGSPITFDKLEEKDLLEEDELKTYWNSIVSIKDMPAFAASLKATIGSDFVIPLDEDGDLDEDAFFGHLKSTLSLEDIKSLEGLKVTHSSKVYKTTTAKLNSAFGSVKQSEGKPPYLVTEDGDESFYEYTSGRHGVPVKSAGFVSVDAGEVNFVISEEVVNTSNEKSIDPIKTPLIGQYFKYLVMVLQGDLGTSFVQYPKKVNKIVADALPWTLALQFPTIVLGWIAGNLLGALAAYKRGLFDKVLFPAALLTNSIPFFAVGMLLVYLFAEMLPIFPSSGGYAIDVIPGFTFAFISSAAYYYVLPFFSIFPVFASGQATGMRTMGIYELGTGYIKYAKTLGIKENKILMYVFRNAMLPQLTGLAIMLGVMIGGALITEMIFSYPGLGMALLAAAQNNDYPLIQGAALIVTITVLLANFSVDILIGFFDPRVKAGRTGA